MTDFNRPGPESNPDQQAESEPTLTALQRHFDWVVSENPIEPDWFPVAGFIHWSLLAHLAGTRPV